LKGIIAFVEPVIQDRRELMRYQLGDAAVTHIRRQLNSKAHILVGSRTWVGNASSLSVHALCTSTSLEIKIGKIIP
jgi:hypothetical protein